jgi:hypothetical protein
MGWQRATGCDRRLGEAWSRSGSPGRVRAGEEVTQGSPFAQGECDTPAMLWAVVEQMAPLAQRLDVAVTRTAMGGIVIQMSGCQHDLGGPGRRVIGQERGGDLAAAAVTPGLAGLVPPASIAQMPHDLAVRPSAA